MLRLHPLVRALLALSVLSLVAACGDGSSHDSPAGSDAAADTDRGDTDDRDTDGRDAAPDGSTEDAGDDASDSGPGDGGGDDADATPPAPSLETRAGSRLVPVGYALGDLFELTGIHDRELDLACDWMMTGSPDDEPAYHCVPHLFGEVRYTDADCSDEAILVRGSVRSACGVDIEPGAIVRAAGATECGGNELVVRQLGSQLGADGTLYRRSYVDGSCVEDTPGESAVFEAAPADLDGLVSATVAVVDTAEPGLEAEVYVGSDGSSFRAGLRWDDGTACTRRRVDHDGIAQPCIPSDVLNASDNIYSDDGCSEPVFTGQVDVGCEDEPDWSWGFTMAPIDGCFFLSGLYELGEPAAAPYSGDGEFCEAFDAPEDWRMFGPAAERPLDEVPTTELVRVGDGRLQLAHVAATDGTVLYPERDWWDTTFDDHCSPRMFSDGSVRCVVGGSFTSDGYFTDEACSEPAYVAFAGGCNPGPDEPRIRLETEFDEGSCRQIVTHVGRLVRHEGPVYFEPDGCAEATLDPSQVALVDGEALSAEDFVELEVVVP